MYSFSAVEINLMCVYDTANRRILLSSLRAGLNDVYDLEMREVFECVIEKLERLTDKEFSEIGFYAADEFFEGGNDIAE